MKVIHKFSKMAFISVSALVAISGIAYLKNQKKRQKDKPTYAVPVGFESFDRDNQTPEVADLPDDKQKRAFLSLLYPVILKANAGILRDRARVLYIRNSAKISGKQAAFVQNLAKRYKLKKFNMSNESHWEELLRRVDIVPAALALAQAATESGWGTSRFAKHANNFFGQSCFSPGCGLAPRGSGRPKFEAQKFSSPAESVFSYIHNLNSHAAYKPMRAIRAQLRERGDHLDATKLVKGLERYSELGKTYIEMIRLMIHQNELHKYPSLPENPNFG